MLLWFAIAMADDLDLSDWVEVEHVQTIEGGLMDANEAWYRAPDGCHPATIEAGATPRFEVAICEQDHGDVRVACTAGTSIRDTFLGMGRNCSWESTEGSGGGWGGGGSYGSHGNPVLIELTEDRIVWARTVAIEVDFRQHTRRVNPCTAKSLRKLGDEAPEDGQRTCDASTGLVHRIVPVGWGRGIGVGQIQDPTEVDCREACPENPERAAVAEAADKVRGKRFTAKGGERVALFRTLEQCEAAEGDAWKALPEPECDPDEKPWAD